MFEATAQDSQWLESLPFSLDFSVSKYFREEGDEAPSQANDDRRSVIEAETNDMILLHA